MHENAKEVIILEDIAEMVIENAANGGADYAEARYHKNTGIEFSLKNNVPQGVRVINDEGIGIRVLVNGGMGFASTNKLGRDSVSQAVEVAIKLARSAAKVRREPVEFSDEKFHRVSYAVQMKKNFENMSVAEKMEYLRRVERAVMDSGVNVPMRFIAYNDWIEEKLFINSEGAQVKSQIPRVSIMYNLVVLENGKMEQAPFVQNAFTGGLEYMEAAKPWESALRDVKALKNLILHGEDAPEGKVDVIIAPEVSGIAVHESVGHPYESDRIYGREAAQAGESFIKPSMLGERIGTDAVNVIEDPTLPGGYGFYLYDDEGVKARPRHLIRNGIINEFLTNREYAKKLGVSSNAAARAVNYNREPIVRMANTYLAPGDYSFEELIGDVKHGVYIKSFNEWNIDDRRYQQRYIGREAYLIENGELKNPVHNPIIEITTRALWGSVDAVGNYIEQYPGTCGKGEPMQGVPVWMGGAPARLRNILLRR